jgi:hypothetical protein
MEIEENVQRREHSKPIESYIISDKRRVSGWWFSVPPEDEAGYSDCDDKRNHGKQCCIIIRLYFVADPTTISIILEIPH